MDQDNKSSQIEKVECKISQETCGKSGSVSVAKCTEFRDAVPKIRVYLSLSG